MVGRAVAQRQDNRTLILEAARELFVKKGLHETTMGDIAAAAGVSRATVFNQFGSRALVLDAIAAEVLGIYLDLVNVTLSGKGSVVGRLTDLAAAMGKGITANRQFYSVVFGELTRASMGFDEAGMSQALRRELNEKLQQLFLRGQVDGELTRAFPAEDMVMAFESQIFGTVSKWLRGQSTEPLEDVMVRTCTILVRGIAGDSI